MLRRNFFSARCSSSSLMMTTVSTATSSFRFASSTSPSVTSKQDIESYKKKAHALFMIRKTPQIALSAEAAIRLITDEVEGQPKTIPQPERMTREEAKQFLRDCHEAGIVVISPSPSPSSESKTSDKQQQQKQIVITEPTAVFNAYRNSDKLAFFYQAMSMRGICESDRCFDTHQKSKPHKLQQSSAAVLSTRADEVAAAAKKAHSRFWAWVALGISCQMLYFSYLTFLVYDWDTMEPFTYFVGCTYMLAFFAYFVRTRRGHTFGEMDRVILSNVIKNRMVVRRNVKSL